MHELRLTDDFKGERVDYRSLGWGCWFEFTMLTLYAAKTTLAYYSSLCLFQLVIIALFDPYFKADSTENSC